MKIGILGGGQLSQMLALAGHPLNIHFVFYVPSISSPVEQLGEVIHGTYDDQKQLTLFANNVDVITYENENIPVASLEYLANLRDIYPGIEPIKLMQDRLFEKQLFNELTIKTTDYLTIDSQADLIAAAKQLQYPFVLKKRRNGYDGKGQVIIKDEQQLLSLNTGVFNDCLAENFIAFEREVSIIGVRSQNGEIKVYDISENQHKKGVLAVAKNKVNDSSLPQAQDYLTRILTKFNYVGVLALEFFEKDKQLIANELAPRVHNSGHWSIEACYCSQFENHLRAIAGLPLGSTESHSNYVMQNVLGQMPDLADLLAKNKVSVHDYGKAAKSGRKIGHITFPAQ